MNIPNLFHYAPSELSQDAVFAWLLAWADSGLAEVNPPLHAAGFAFLRALLGAAGEHGVTSPEAVLVRKQRDHVDIVVEVGADVVLAIEDKVHTGEHGKQLIEYRDALAKRFPAKRRALVYLRTGEQPKFGAVKSAGWTPVGRAEVLHALRPARGASAVLDEFLDHLEGVEHDVGSFAALLPRGWQEVRPDVRQRLVWAGFFQQIRPVLEGDWDYIPNPTGGFMGFWWSFLQVPGGSIYLQLDHDRLVAKVDSGKDGDRRKLRDEWTRRVTHHAGAIRFRRPDRLGHGRWMTVGVVGDYLRVDPDGALDFAATLAVLRSATVTLQELVAATQGASPP